MKRYRLKKSLFLLLPGAIGLGLLVATCALAAEMEVPLPGMPANVSDPGVYIRYLFIFGLSAVGFLAVGGTVVGGIQYMLSGTLTSTEKARKTIVSSLGGVFLLLCSWLLLATIDPTLTNLSPTDLKPITLSGTYKTLGDLKLEAMEAVRDKKAEEAKKVCYPGVTTWSESLAKCVPKSSAPGYMSIECAALSAVCTEAKCIPGGCPTGARWVQATCSCGKVYSEKEKTCNPGVTVWSNSLSKCVPKPSGYGSIECETGSINRDGTPSCTEAKCIPGGCPAGTSWDTRPGRCACKSN